jgi:serine protease Do
MKNNLLRLSGIAAVAVLFSLSVFAQEEKEKEKSKYKFSDDDVLVITKKGLKENARVVIEVRDGEITINGKPVDEYKDGDVTVTRSRTFGSGGRVYSPFRGDAQIWNSDLFEGKSTVPFLGVITEKNDDGAKITSVTNNSAADKAGLKEGDVITHVDEDRIDDHEDLTKAIRKHKPGDKINVTVERDGRERQLVATLGMTGGATAFVAPKLSTPVTPRTYNFDFKDNFQGLNRVYSYSGGRVRLGIRAQDTEDGRGAKVLSVDNDSPADKAGIREGDIITEFEGKDIKDADDLAEAARSVKDQSSMNVRLQRDGRSQTVEVKVAKKLKTTNL